MKISNGVKKILFLEDDPDQIMMYHTKFELEGLLMIAATTGEETIKLAFQEEPDLILLDLLLRRENGLDVLEQIKQKEKLKNIPVIVFTNFDKKEYRQRAQELGAIDFIIKAKTTPGEITKKIKQILGDKTKL